jgi:hypothetical protein
MVKSEHRFAVRQAARANVQCLRQSSQWCNQDASVDLDSAQVDSSLTGDCVATACRCICL